MLNKLRYLLFCLKEILILLDFVESIILRFILFDVPNKISDRDDKQQDRIIVFYVHFGCVYRNNSCKYTKSCMNYTLTENAKWTLYLFKRLTLVLDRFLLKYFKGCNLLLVCLYFTLNSAYFDWLHIYFSCHRW